MFSERSPPLRDRRSSHSRSRSHHRRSYSRSPEYRRRDRSLHRSQSPRSPPGVRLPPEPGTFFLSRESFEEIQAQLRAKSGQPPPEPFSMALPPPARFATFQEPMRTFAPPSYAPVSFRPPPAQVVVAFPYQPPPSMPPASHPTFPPGAGFAVRPPEFVGPSQILMHQQTVITRPVMTLHPAHMPGQPLPAPPHPPNPEMHVFGRPPGPFPPDVRGPFPQQFEGPPPGIPNFLRPPPPFASHDGPPPPMPPPVPVSPNRPDVRFSTLEGSMIETSPDGNRWQPQKKQQQLRKRSNLIYTT